jgi:hypothetical protein
MKEAVEQLDDAQYEFECLNPIGEGEVKSWTKGLRLLKDAISELKNPPRWETPEQWKQRTGEEWPDDWPVWSLTTDRDEILTITTMGEEEARKTWGNHIYAIATEAGPPPDGWRPEDAP